MRALDRRLSRLESVSHALDEALVSPEALKRMAAVTQAECARVREKLMSDGPHEPAGDCSRVDSDARRPLREKLLRDDPPPAESARA